VLEDRPQGGDELGVGRRREGGEPHDVAGHGEPDDLGGDQAGPKLRPVPAHPGGKGQQQPPGTSSRMVAAASSSDAAARMSPVTVLRPSGLSRMARTNSATRRPSP
jgi:hypothetical protein